MLDKRLFLQEKFNTQHLNINENKYNYYSYW